MSFMDASKCVSNEIACQKIINMWLREVEMLLTAHSKNLITMKSEVPIFPYCSMIYQTFVLCYIAQVFLFLFMLG